MEFTVVNRMQLNQTVERILHVPGNFSGGQLEMTIVWDHNLEEELAKTALMHVSQTLKTHSEVFRNVRLNLVHWRSDGEMVNEVLPLMRLTMSSFYENEWKEKAEKEANPKDLLFLMQYLKKFHARSKLIFLVTGGDYRKIDTEEEKLQLKKSMEPFLEKKIGKILCKEESMEIIYRKPNMWIN